MLENIYNTDASLMEWNDATLIMYISVVLLAFLFGHLSQNSKVVILCANNKIYRPKHRINYLFFLFIFFVLFFLMAFRNVGTDLSVYRNIFYYANTDYVDTFGNEPGFVLINKIIRYFTDNENVAILAFSLISILMIYKTIEYYSDKLDVSIALLAYASMFYFQSFNLLRIYLASYFLCYMFKYVLDGEVLKYSLITFVCISVHYSSVLMIFPILFYYLYRKNKMLFTLGLLIFIIALYLSLNYLSILNIFERYSKYLENNSNSSFGLGLGQIMYHLPLFLFLYYLKRNNYASQYWDLFFVYTIFSFIFGMLGYKVLMIGRVTVYFMPIYVILLPYYIRELKIYHDKYYFAFKITFIIYFLFRCHMYFKEYLGLDSIMPYKIIERL